MILYLFNGLLLTMNASSWIKAADLVAKATPATSTSHSYGRITEFAKPPAKHIIST